jgi:hypothetical protein
MRFIFDEPKTLFSLRFKRFAPFVPPGPPALDRLLTLGTQTRALPQ